MLGEEYVVLIGLTGLFHARLVRLSHIWKKLLLFHIFHIQILQFIYYSYLLFHTALSSGLESTC
jgi:hypothetical protein